MQEGAKAQPSPPLYFPRWDEHLAAGGLPESVRLGHGITLRWYLGFCRRQRRAVSFDSARDFIAALERDRQPSASQLEVWKEALRWFFREGKALAAGGSGVAAPRRRPDAWASTSDSRTRNPWARP